jgi:hypothetical protein
VDFERALATEEDFKRFYLFFRREAFVPKGPESKSFLDGVLEGSEQYAIRVGNNLKDVVFTRVFPQLAKGFLEYHSEERKEPVDEETLKKTYRGTLALLYRLLFLLYAEARDLLPTQDRLGYGARGINAIKEQVADRLDTQYTYTGGYVLWQSLKDLFRVVEGGTGCRLRAASLTWSKPTAEQTFSPLPPFLSKADCLPCYECTQPHGRAKRLENRHEGEGRGARSLRGVVVLPILPAALALEPVLVLLAVGHGGAFERLGGI